MFELFFGNYPLIVALIPFIENELEMAKHFLVYIFLLGHYFAWIFFFFFTFSSSALSLSLFQRERYFIGPAPCIGGASCCRGPNNIKTIPDNISAFLTPVAFAHWIMGDGSVQRHGLIICTDSYTIPEIVRLMNVLMIRYRLDCTLRFHTAKQYNLGFT